MTRIFLILFIACAALILVLLRLLRQTRAELNDIVRFYSNLAGTTGFDNVIKLLQDEIVSKGIEVIGFYRKSTLNNTLASGSGAIPLLEKSSAVKAFYTLKPCRLGSHHAADRELAKELGHDTVFIPVHMKREEPCWNTTGCGSRGCTAHNTHGCACWLESGRMYRGALMNSHNEKLSKCIRCKSFLPIGVFAVRGSKAGAVHTFINNHCSGALKNSVLYERALYSATMDGLTQVMNRRSMEEQLLAAFRLSEKYRHPLSICLFDIDHFKKFNDTYGHQTGDMILKDLAALVSAMVREVDIVARYGGEEFCLIFPHTDKARAFEISERIREEVEAREFPTGKRVTISMGVASHPDDNAVTYKELLKKADIALYRSKVTRNAVTAYRDSFGQE